MEENRRPLKVREQKIPISIAKYLSKKDITPNQISVWSIVFSIVASIFIVCSPTSSEMFGFWLYPILGAVFIQMRLLCNLFDGMVALEGGKSTKSGELYNDIPDRVSDSIIFISIGYYITVVSFGPELGYLGALFAMMTAYVRVLGSSMGAGAFFSGPMAKQHRMALVTTSLVLTPIELSLFDTNYVLCIALSVIVIGSVLTVMNRIHNIYVKLEK